MDTEFTKGFKAAMEWKRKMNTECECNYCKCGDQPFDPELTLEMRIDIAEAALMGIRQHLWQLDSKLKDLVEWSKKTDRDMRRDLER
jgi:hypothetical protein